MPAGAADANLELIRRHYVAYDHGDLDALMATIAPDAEFVPGDEAAQGFYGKNFKGHDEIRGFFQALEDLLAHRRVEVLDLQATDDERVVASVIMYGTYRSNEISGSMRGVHAFTIRNGLIARNEQYTRPD